MVTNRREDLVEQRERVPSLIFKDDISRLVTIRLLSIYMNQNLAQKHLYHIMIIVNGPNSTLIYSSVNVE